MTTLDEDRAISGIEKVKRFLPPYFPSRFAIAIPSRWRSRISSLELSKRISPSNSEQPHLLNGSRL
jgi:hypothetical protein